MRRLTTNCWMFALVAGCSGSPSEWSMSGQVATDDPGSGSAPPGNTASGSTDVNQTAPGSGDSTSPVNTQPGAPNPEGSSDTSTAPALPTTPGETQPVPVACEDGVGGPMLRRLTARELSNTVTDLLRVPVTLTLPHDPNNGYGFSTTASTLLFSSNFLDQLSEQVRTAIASVDVNDLRSAYGACASSDACDQSVALAFARAALRRPLTSAENQRYAQLWSDLRALGTPDEALQGSLEAATLSPGALYRSELGTVSPSDASLRELDAYELASSIAYTFSASAPDAALLQAAADDTLATPAERVTHAQRLVGTERGQAQLLEFFRQWWRYGETQFLAKDSGTYPSFTSSIQQKLVSETDRFVLDVLGTRGTLSDLLLSPHTFLDPELAAFYGLAATTEEVARYTKLSGRGVGLLAHGSVLARWALPNSSSPTQRGAFVRRSLLCESLPLPPPNIAQVPEPTPNTTTRARYEEVHAVASGCAACHSLTDQVGFAFEHFDGAGQYRADEGGLVINAKGELVGRDIAFDGQEQLAAALVDLPEVRGCLARHWVSFAFGVNPEQTKLLADEQRCNYEDAPGALSDLFAAYAASSHFARRAAL